MTKKKPMDGTTQFCEACIGPKHRCSRRLMTPEEQFVVTKARQLIYYANDETGGKEGFKRLPEFHGELQKAVNDLDLMTNKEPL